MSTSRSLIIPFMVIVTVFVSISNAETISTVFTYEGWFEDANEPAEGIYDLELVLYDHNDPNIGIPIGFVIEVNDCNVIDGTFIVDVDFSDGDPNVFNGQKRWVEIQRGKHGLV